MKWTKNINAGLVIGFGVAIALMVAMYGIGIVSIDAIQTRLKNLSDEQHVKSELVNRMRSAARERTLILHRMIILDDLFERDEEFMRFNRFALMFITARNALLAMNLSEEETKVLEEQGELTVDAVRLQDRVIDLTYAEELEKAKQLLIRQAMTAQDLVFKKLKELTDIQLRKSQLAIQQAEKQYQQTKAMMQIFGLFAFVIGVVVAIVVIRRTSITEANLYLQKEHVQVTLNSIGDGVITTDAAGQVDYVNQVAQDLTGVSIEDAKGKPLFEVLTLVTEEGFPPKENPVLRAIHEKRIIENYEIMSLVRTNGDSFSVELTTAPIRNLEGKIIGAVLVFRNITAVRDMANQMAYQATHDALTGLINRNEFERRLVEAINIARNNNEEHVLCYMDLDQFKVVNDTCGHIAGDELLKQLTVLLHRKIRRSDTLARLGGDEFGILFLDCKLEQALKIINELRSTINEYRFVWSDKAFNVGVSIGVVAIDRDSGGLTEIMSAADSSCFISKDLGRNRIHVYQPDDTLLSQRRGEMQWLPRIKDALDNGKFQLFFQKMISIADGTSMLNYEILVRMIGNDGKEIPTTAFLPAAERYDLMPAIDRWVVENVFSYLVQYLRYSPTGFNLWCLNVSGQSLCDEKFMEFIIDRTQHYDVDPTRICFEITETAAVSNLSSATHMIAILRELGFHFALDDFGSGLSSFNYLKNLPVDFLKIDGSFVKDIFDDPIDYAMVESINQIGHILGLKTIAEFVENEETLQILKKLKVDYAQGYAVHKPEALKLPRDKVAEI